MSCWECPHEFLKFAYFFELGGRGSGAAAWEGGGGSGSPHTQITLAHDALYICAIHLSYNNVIISITENTLNRASCLLILMGIYAQLQTHLQAYFSL
jgi:hypothetical protein